MALTVGEMQRINTLLNWMLSIPGGNGAVPANQAAIDAAVWLADRAYDAHGCGLTGSRVRVAWETGPPTPSMKLRSR